MVVDIHLNNTILTKCVICKEAARVAVRGYIEQDYVNVCSFHAGVFQAIIERLGLMNFVKWKPLYENNLDTREVQK